MLRSLYSTISVVFMSICTVLTRPMYLAENLDTTLRLGTSNPGTIKISQLRKVDPSSSTLAPSSTFSKLADPLELTLGPVSEVTTENVVIPKNHKFSDTLGIRKTYMFKHLPQQKLPFGPTPKTWPNHHNIQLTKPGPHLLGDHHNTMPSNNLMLKPLPPGFSPHPRQGSGSRNLNTHKFPTHRLPRFPGSSSAEGFPTRESSVQKFANIKLDEPLPKIGPPSQKSKVSEETKVPGTYSSGHEEGLTSQKKYQNVIDPHSQKAVTAIRQEMSILSAVGTKVMENHVAFRVGIKKSLTDLQNTLIQRIIDEGPVGIESKDIERAFRRVERKLVTAFVGFLMKKYNDLRHRSKDEILNSGWTYLESYMKDWQDLNFEVAFKLKDIKVDSGVWEWSPHKFLIYMMWMDSRFNIPSEVLSRLISGWRESNG